MARGVAIEDQVEQELEVDYRIMHARVQGDNLKQMITFGVGLCGNMVSNFTKPKPLTLNPFRGKGSEF